MKRRRPTPVLALAFALAVGCAVAADAPRPLSRVAGGSTATPEGRGEIREVDGKRIQVRYREAPFSLVTANFEQWSTYVAGDTRTFPPPSRVPMPAIAGDPRKGRALFTSRAKGPCTGCHLVPGADIWPAGNVGPDLSVIGDRRLPNRFLFDLVWDPRNVFPESGMPPWGTAGILSAEEIVHVVAFLQTLKGNPPFVPPPETDPARNPNTRPHVARYWGDNLDPTNNPAVLYAESALGIWSERGPAGKACGDCHAGGLEVAMRGVATRYPRHFDRYGRVLSLDDFLAVHVPETTGRALPSQSREHINLTMLVKMQSNGMAVNVDVTSPPARAAWERGRALYYKRVGQRNHACADCHDVERGGGRYIGGRRLSVTADGLTRNFPYWFTIVETLWNVRHRLQFCMLPLGMNYLPADAPEYADLELYLTAFDNGKPMSVPGIR
jgi:sulfur-oxidizing protein SoxA